MKIRQKKLVSYVPPKSHFMLHTRYNIGDRACCKLTVKLYWQCLHSALASWSVYIYIIILFLAAIKFTF